MINIGDWARNLLYGEKSQDAQKKVVNGLEQFLMKKTKEVNSVPTEKLINMAMMSTTAPISNTTLAKQIYEKQIGNLLTKIESSLPLKGPIKGFEKNIINDTATLEETIKAIAKRKETRDLLDKARAILQIRGLNK